MPKRKAVKIRRRDIVFKALICLSLALNLLIFHCGLMDRVSKMRPIKRYTSRLIVKGWLSQWNMDF